MRIISGRFKGRVLSSFQADHIRPTTDRVKETLFNKWMSYTEAANVLDLFSGTGNLGLESLSRGCRHVDFVDLNLKSIQILHTLLPEYTDYHFRLLHKEIQDASKIDYQKEDYYRAFIEAMKRYIISTRNKSGSTNATDNGMMGEVFGRGKVLSVAKNYKKPDGTDFTPLTLENIEEGQKFLSMGILSGGRNPVSHEEISDLRESGLFTEMDCLDALSLLSHLVRRLDDAAKP